MAIKINYTFLEDDEKLDLLRLLYFDAKNASDKANILAETQLVIARIRQSSH